MGQLAVFLWCFYICYNSSDNLLGLGGNSVQLLQWMISLTTGMSWERGGGARPRPGIMGFMGVMPDISLRLGSKSGVRTKKHIVSNTAAAGKAVTQSAHTLRNLLLFPNHHSVTDNLYCGIIWAHAGWFMFHFTLCTSSLNTEQHFCQQWWHTSSL